MKNLIMQVYMVLAFSFAQIKEIIQYLCPVCEKKSLA